MSCDPETSGYERLPWQDEIWARMVRMHSANRLPHALLLSGPVGIGKVRFAANLAQFLLCETPVETNSPCGACKGCNWFKAETHPDFRLISPEDDAKSGEIKIEAIRELVAREGLTSHEGRYKIIVITPADRMNTAAANSLLKTLEEPAARTLLILITADPARLPATVHSRCHQIDFLVPKPESVRGWLAGRVEHGDPNVLLGLAAGAPLAALALDSADILDERSRMLEEFMDMAAGRRDPVKIAERWSTLDISMVLSWIAGWLIDMLRCQTGFGNPVLFNPDRGRDLRNLAERLDSRQLHRLLDDAREARRALVTTLNVQLMLEKLLIGWTNTANIAETNLTG